jgi:hypothetical protein
MRRPVHYSAVFATVAVLLTLDGCGGSSIPSSPSIPNNPVVYGEWTWVSGSSTVNQAGIYGTQGVAAPGNTPGARSGAASWTDASGNLWLFGGNYGYGGTGLIGPGGQTNEVYGDFSDLWKFNAGQWAWVGGNNGLASQVAGVYGAKGVPSVSNQPGARHGATTWTDTSGNFWLFGGIAYDSANKQGYINDLWEYSNGQWIWISGVSTVNQPGAYGTQGTASTGNAPGARSGATSWMDASGAFWLFGGVGYDSSGTACYNIIGAVCALNDLWKFSGGQWTWVTGANVMNQQGIYGAKGTPSPGNSPGGRADASGVVDSSGNLWLIGGNGFDAAGGLGPLNDLWKFSGGQWIWVGGSSTISQPGTYGSQGVTASGNSPGARWLSTAWIDKAGNIWLFGGQGYDEAGNYSRLNDLWKYSNSQWTWMSGSSVGMQSGTYGTQGTPAAGNVPGAREWATGWIDASGNLWLFGGSDSSGNNLNDLWEYQP